MDRSCVKSRLTSDTPRFTVEKSGVAVQQLEATVKNSGFTLIEVLVAMVLVAMITLIMAFALRINLQAWERGVTEGEKVQIEVVLTHMVEKQLRAMVSRTSFSSSSQVSSSSADQASIASLSGITSLSTGVMQQLPFIGRAQTLSFYTLYSPEGTPSQGLIRVAYLYDPGAKKLTVYEKVIGSEDDIKESNGLFTTTGKAGGGKAALRASKSGKSSRADKQGVQMEPVATILDVEQFSLSFMAEEESTALKMDGSSFQDFWDENSPDPPGFIRLLFAQTKRRGGAPSVWLFRVGGKI